MGDESALLGREDTLARCRAELAGGGGVLLTGPAGIGKTAVLDALAAGAARTGTLVLRSSSSATEATLPHLALYDLFAGVLAGGQGADLLAPHLRAVLDVALLRTPAGAEPDRLAIRVATLELLRALAARGPVLLVLDDAHCLDPDSAEVIGFAVRRLRGHPVAVAATERVEDGGEPTCLGLLPAPRTEMPVGTLPGPVIGELLRARLGLPVHHRASRRIQAASGGNPYFALELARAARRFPVPAGTGDPLPVPERLRDLLAGMLAELPRPSLEVLLLLAAAARPRLRLPEADQRALAAAVAAGVVADGPGADTRFTHPLLREIIYADATPEQRRACHARLADLLDDPLERARHHALATARPDAAIAGELAAAARLAVGRGAPALAAELARLAAERTPDDPALAAERLLASARHSYDAGLSDQATDACEAVLHGGGSAARVGARLLLAAMAGGDRAGVPALLAAAEADAGGTPRLRAAVLLRRADHLLSTGHIHDGLAVLAEAERHAVGGGDVDQQLEVVSLRAPIEMQLRPASVPPSLRHAAELTARRSGRAVTAASIQVRCCEVVWLLRGGDVAGAVAAVNALRSDVEGAGRVKDLADVLHMVASVHERAGLCATAHQAAALGGRMRLELQSTRGPGLVLSAAGELNGGTAPHAADLADAAVRAGEQAGDTEWAAYGYGLRGRADLLLGRMPQAADHLGRCRALLHRLGFVDPALFLVDADLAEALARAGRTTRARQVLTEASASAARLDRHVVRLGLARAQAVLDGLDGDPRGAADRLRAAVPPAHPYPLEAARALLVLGELERRARRRAAARTDLEDAVRAFAAAQCLPWLAVARERLARLDGPVAGPLNDTERRIVELVQTGATNRQIAAALHVSVKSVEAGLTRLFRRFGVRSRTELTSRRLVG